jgi:radical SAM protein with 4Fe4S-binding SPASM domain
MQKSGIVYKLYPLLGIANSLLHGEKDSLLRCGGGWINYAIQTDGNIIPCPTMWGMRDYYLGHIADADPLKLRKLFVGEPCASCETLGVCGGRCLYANIARRWNKDAYFQVCNTVRGLIATVEKQLPRIRELSKNGRINLKDFDFVKYNGCEIIP